MGSPTTFMIRPSVALPTGTLIGPSVSITSWPRTSPSEAVHGDRAHGVLAQVLRDLKHQAFALVLGFQRVQNLGQVIVELNVDDGTDDLGHFAGSHLPLFGCLPVP